jgi:HK97 family phage prohead protease
MTEPLLRAIPEAAVAVEGRTVDVRVVPFDTVATVADPPNFVPYQEEFLRGCFDHQLNAANRIRANVDHEKGIANVVGHGVSLREESDGYHLTATIHKTAAGDTTLELLRAGALPGVSAEFYEAKNVRRGGVMQRAKAHLFAFAFAAKGAYRGADVLALRAEEQEEPQTLDAELFPAPIDPELVERLRAKGIKLPSRYEAHPAPTDTPSADGTSDDGTRQAEEFADYYVANHANPSLKE